MAEKESFDQGQAVEGKVFVKVNGDTHFSRTAEYETLMQSIARTLHFTVGTTLLKNYSSGWQLVSIHGDMSVQNLTDIKNKYETAAEHLRKTILSDPKISATQESILERKLTISVQQDQLVMIPKDPISSTPEESNPRIDLSGKIPNDPVYPRLGRYKVLEAPEAWAISTGSRNVIVAVIDSGVDYNHEDLGDNMWKGSGGKLGYNTCTGENDPAPFGSHGTHVAGIIGEIGNNETGGVGVNWEVSILSVNMFCGSSTAEIEDADLVSTDSEVMNAYEYIIQAKRRGENIRVANNSWRNVPPDNFRETQRDQIRRAGEEGILSIFAAGNDERNNDENPTYPASYKLSSIISVLATNLEDEKAGFSSYGKQSVHIGAPGVSIWSTLPNNSYGTKSGTSMATPVVAGAAALLLSVKPELTPEQVKQRIMKTGDTVSNLNNYVRNSKRLNLKKMLQGLGNPDPNPGPDPNPDKNKILFTSRRDNGLRQIYMMNLDGSGQKRVTNTSSDEYSPRFTADGSKIVYVSLRDGYPNIYIMNRDGSNQQPLTSETASNEDPDILT